MQFMLMIYGDEAAWESPAPGQYEAEMELHNRFSEQVVEMGGSITGGAELKPTSTATTIRGDHMTDGPFLETKEALGGFYMIEANDLDHAIAIAKLCPASGGAIEIRPIVE